MTAQAKLASDPNAALIRAAWQETADTIHAYCAKQRPKLKQYQAHHFFERAREAFLKAYVDNRPCTLLKTIALARVGLTQSRFLEH